MSEQAERIAQIKGRVEAATPGPWFVEKIVEYGETSHVIPDVIRWRGYLNGLSLGEDRETAAFIANAPADITYLLNILTEKDAT